MFKFESPVPVNVTFIINSHSRRDAAKVNSYWIAVGLYERMEGDVDAETQKKAVSQ